MRQHAATCNITPALKRSPSTPDLHGIEKENPMKIIPICFALAVALPAFAQTSAPAEAPRKPASAEVIDTLVLPALPKGRTRADFDRDHKVTTRTTDAETVTEYRLKGKLYKMVVKPKSGPAYTMIDEKGEGKFVPMGEPGTKISVPMWVIHSW